MAKRVSMLRVDSQRCSRRFSSQVRAVPSCSDSCVADTFIKSGVPEESDCDGPSPSTQVLFSCWIAHNVTCLPVSLVLQDSS